MDTKPILSFCIPTFCRSKRVVECVKHILSYKSDEIEVVVSDNASADDTLEQLSQINDPRLSVFTNEKNIQWLNWPLAISRANGKWAALMSDEDIVNIDELDYYLDLLKKPETDDVGAILYKFPPIVSWLDKNCYISDKCEATAFAIRHGGHITGFIQNMKWFHMKGLHYYIDMTVPTLFGGCPEPQLDVLLETVNLAGLMLSTVPLCIYGKPINLHEEHPARRDDAGGDIEKYMNNGLSPAHRENQWRTAIRTACKFHSPSERSTALYNIVTRKYLALIAETFKQTLTEEDHHLFDIFRSLKKGFGINTYEDAARALCVYIENMCGTIVKMNSILCETSPDSYWITLPKVFRIFAARDYNHSYADFNRGDYRNVLTGDFLFSTMIKLYKNSDSITSPEQYYIPFFGDTLGLTTREILRRNMRNKEYDNIISCPIKNNIRLEYYRGEAYLRLAQYDEAQKCFEFVVDKVFNPQVLEDIIIDETAVQFSLYYLGKIAQSRGDVAAADKYLNRCTELSHMLLINANMYSENLWHKFDEQ